MVVHTYSVGIVDHDYTVTIGPGQAVEPSFLLMESGDFLLLESGDKIILEA